MFAVSLYAISNPRVITGANTISFDMIGLTFTVSYPHFKLMQPYSYMLGALHNYSIMLSGCCEICCFAYLMFPCVGGSVGCTFS